MPTISGVTRDSSGDPVGSVGVTAFRTSNDFPQGAAVSDGSGNYSITVPGLDDHYVVAYLPGTTDTMGVTQNDITPTGTAFDADAVLFIRRMMASDQKQLEPAVMTALNDFIIGLKSDGLWEDILTGCLMVGARTLRGALTDIKGVVPLYGENFVDADYNRITGLMGDGSTKSVVTTIQHTTLARDDHHLSVWATEVDTTNSGRWLLGGTLAVNQTFLSRNSNSDTLRTRSATSSDGSLTGGYVPGFMGLSRNNADDYQIVGGGLSTTITNATTGQNNYTFRALSTGAASNYSASRLAWYSLGSSLSLTDLDARLSTVLSAIETALT
jgi:hypothetical protein